jgi:hypothetical protein
MSPNWPVGPIRISEVNVDDMNTKKFLGRKALAAVVAQFRHRVSLTLKTTNVFETLHLIFEFKGEIKIIAITYLAQHWSLIIMLKATFAG